MDPNKRITSGSLDMLRVLATESFPKFAFFQEKFPDFYQQIENLEEGCIVVEVPKPNDPKSHYLFPVWKGRGSCNLMLPKEDLHELRHRVFEIDIVKERSQATTAQDQVSKPSENVNISKTVQVESEVKPLAESESV